MAEFVLEREQFLPIGQEHAWEFFSSPKNLARITPPKMGFVIKSALDDKPMYAGQRITYTVRPLFGLPLTWVTRIAEVDAPHAFVDTQEKGPYAKWWHKHTFIPVDGGTLMKDRVEYRLPLGPLGDLAHTLFVKSELESIFDFRTETLSRMFPGHRA